jgi:UDP-N-acetylmuramate-alanine ligase
LNIYKKNINDYIKEIDKYLNIIDKIFICTDENNILEIIKKKYGDKVIYYNSIRSYNDKPVHLNNSNDKFKVGQDVIVESVLMSKCEYFLHGTSNVAAAVKIFNPEIKSKNIDII